jgi:hypothetical protein
MKVLCVIYGIHLDDDIIPHMNLPIVLIWAPAGGAKWARGNRMNSIRVFNCRWIKARHVRQALFVISQLMGRTHPAGILPSPSLVHSH